jgi:hypothetical protein
MAMSKKSGDDVFTVARVTRSGNLIVNVEVADQEWIDEHQNDPWFYFPKAPDRDGNYPIIDLHYDPVTELFEQRHPAGAE